MFQKVYQEEKLKHLFYLMLAFTISCSNIDDELTEDSNVSMEDEEITFIEGDEDIEIVDSENIDSTSSLDDFEEDVAVSDFDSDSSTTIVTTTSNSDEFSEDFNSDVNLTIDNEDSELFEDDNDIEIASLEDDENFNDNDGWDDEFEESDSDFEIASSNAEFESETIAANVNTNTTIISQSDNTSSIDENLSLDNFEETAVVISADGSMADTSGMESSVQVQDTLIQGDTGLTSQTIITTPAVEQVYETSVATTVVPVEQVYETGVATTVYETAATMPIEQVYESTSVSGKGIAGVDNYQTTVAYTNTCEESPYSTDYVDFVERLAANEECGLGVCEGRPVPQQRYSEIAPSKRITAPSSRSGHNRYYYVRSCDTSPAIIAQTIFGDPSRSGELGRNIASIGSLKPGKRITYRSSIDPNDPVMKSFYEESPGVVKKYKVKAGENLASIAYKVYGDSRSWKEIALLNNLDNPDALEVGQRLTLNYKQ